MGGSVPNIGTKFSPFKLLLTLERIPVVANRV